MSWTSLVQISARYTRWTFFTYICFKNCNVCLKRAPISVWSFFLTKNYSPPLGFEPGRLGALYGSAYQPAMFCLLLRFATVG